MQLSHHLAAEQPRSRLAAAPPFLSPAAAAPLQETVGGRRERNERERERETIIVLGLGLLICIYIVYMVIALSWAYWALAFFKGGPYKLSASKNRFMETDNLRRLPPKIVYFRRWMF